MNLKINLPFGASVKDIALIIFSLVFGGVLTTLGEKGKPVVLFKPDFAVRTGWAYEYLAGKMSRLYQPEAVDTGMVEKSIQHGALKNVLSNTFEASVGNKYLALPTLLEQLRASGVACLMSGSGSCCFALPEDKNMPVAQIKTIVQEAWGESVFWVETFIC